MPLQVNEQGERNAVIKRIEALQELGEDSKTPAKDQTQANNLKAYLVAEIKAVPAEFNGVIVRSDCNISGGRTASVTIIPQKFAL